jgi:hypothetical protein
VTSWHAGHRLRGEAKLSRTTRETAPARMKYGRNALLQNGPGGFEGRVPLPQAGTAIGSGANASKRTETSLETPGSSMVTPYMTCAISMVRLLCVIRMN